MKIIARILCFSTLFFFTVLQATPTIPSTKENGILIPTQTSPLAQKNKQFIQDFFTWLDTASNSDKAITKKELTQYFDNHVIYTVNGKTLAFDAAHLLGRLNKIKAFYKKVDVVLPVKILIIANNYIAVHYQIKIENKQHKNYLDDIAVLITLKKHKIIAWRAVIAHHDD